MRDSERKFRSLYEAAPLAIVRSSIADGRILEANPAFHAMSGYEPQDLSALSLASLASEGSLEQDKKVGADLRKSGVYGPIERECVRKDGSRMLLLVNGMRGSGPEGHGSIWSIAQDITTRREMELELRRMASTDRLTGLANRSVLMTGLNRCIKQAGESPGFRFGVLYVDLDQFKAVNDSMGHSIGDSVLQEVSDRLRFVLGSADLRAHVTPEVAARVGGDEFVVLLAAIPGAADAMAVAERLLSRLSEPYRILDRVFYISASIGVVVGNQGGANAEDYLHDADTAMYEAKRSGRSCCALFDASMRERVQRRLLILNEMGSAVHQSQFRIAWQPLVSIDSGRMFGCEALIRWRHPRVGPIGPAEFIPIAEDSGLIQQVDDWVLRTACAQFAGWRRSHGADAPAYLSVNISRVQLMDGNFSVRVREILQQCGLPPRCLHLEITETAVMRDPESALRVMQSLKALGVYLDLDDFGVGYSSLSSIHNFPIDVIKIDSSFVRGMDSSRRVTAIVEVVTNLARQLDLELVAEGIETTEQLERVRQLGCHYGQGYLFSPPIDSADFPRIFLGKVLPMSSMPVSKSDVNIATFKEQ